MGLFVIDNTKEASIHYLSDLRNETKDVFLTPFKGLRADGMFRRRLDYKLTRDLINYVV